MYVCTLNHPLHLALRPKWGQLPPQLDSETLQHIGKTLAILCLRVDVQKGIQLYHLASNGSVAPYVVKLIS
ncbi:hypothetical protein PROFUN_04013 [Planoprotostelium fungivorum]|uniref:Uncharacterized protein n=1 Tax=Planoprotostelium fungivorum TaxID=1890364 RepID=A0A2P6NW63_9EUKA|nr:hypothetical protein PROFUN_04013 [Planoprotostelium fungivorum]